MTRKEFVTLTFTLIGSAAAACSSSSSSNDGGTGGSFGSGGNGSGGNGTGGSTGAGGSNNASCANPLPETQVTDSTGHHHTVTIPASDLDATTDRTITTSEPMADTAGGTVVAHTHMVTLTTANLATLKGGGSVTATSSPASDGHMHTYMVSCGATTGAGGSSGGAGTGAAGHTGGGGHVGGGGHTGAAGNTGAAGA
jgi:hypothetical protein